MIKVACLGLWSCIDSPVAQRPPEKVVSSLQYCFAILRYALCCVCPSGTLRASQLILGRMQIHGHDFSCTAVIPCPQDPGSYMFASGSEEKMIRVFEAPQAFADTLSLAGLTSGQPPSSAAQVRQGSSTAIGFQLTSFLHDVCTSHSAGSSVSSAAAFYDNGVLT